MGLSQAKHLGFLMAQVRLATHLIFFFLISSLKLGFYWVFYCFFFYFIIQLLIDFELIFIFYYHIIK